MKRDLREDKGITLIALIITVIVLIILASVTINMVVGDNGIITKTKYAKEQTIIGEEKEIINLSYATCKTEDYLKDIVSAEDLQKEIEKYKKNVNVSMIDNDLLIFFKDTKHEYMVNQNGQISEITENQDRIVDMISVNIAVTASGKVIYINEDKFVEEKLSKLNIDNCTIITEDGVKKINEGIFVDNKGKVYTWGDNYFGQLGDGSNNDRDIPICISDLENDLNGKKIVDICVNYKSMIALDETGRVYTWGGNGSGELGNGTNENINIPTCISNLENDLNGRKIMDIYAGSSSVIVLDETGKVYTWGKNNSGKLGNGTNENINIPTCISNLENDLNGKKIVDIYVNYNSMIALDETGKVYTWGNNYDGQLGNGTNENINIPTCISNLENDLNGRKIVDIYTDSGLVIAQDEVGKVYTWGEESIPTCISDLENDLNGKKIVDISIDSGSVIALDEVGKVYTWGNNYDGQLGDGSNNDRDIPICISNLENDLNGKKIVDISINDDFIITLDEVGRVYTWGNNDYGQLLDGSYEDKNIPICISNLNENVLNNKIIKKHRYFSSMKFKFNFGFCYITQAGEVYYYYWNQPV